MSVRQPGRILVAGATGSIGRPLVAALAAAGPEVRALARRPEQAGLPATVEVVPGDVLRDRGLAAALDGVDVAYYLVHAMGRGNDGDFAELDRRGARAFGAAAERAGVRRLVYLGGLDGAGAERSHHLRSRAEVAAILARHVPEPVHARAAMVIAPDSQSFVILRNLVRRLPVMVCPAWVATRSQPIAGRDVTAALATLATIPAVPGEVQLGGGEVLTYREMMARTAAALGRRRPPMLPVPVMTPRLSSRWVSLFGGVEYPLVRPLVDGLRAEMVVTEPPPPGVNDAPLGFDAAVRAAIDG
ncbi:NAD(P)H-binding protein [Patulibacter defluvii]|uniref:NAD(P)H-binding protein n=1 Tax=Patulibacter defluvii TaxID=3095358 RepID=UPI002A75DAFA|nr:NAD(P)H-binding protein [Patulibacter sp. DM4]